jgi:exonuclease SbcD
VKLEAGKKPETERLNLSSGRPLKRAVFKTVEEAVAWLKENEEAFTEITMRTKTFLETDDLRALRQASPHLINIIPEPEEDGQHQRRGDDIDLTKDVRHLFSDFFIKQQGQEPNDEIKDLFNEILSIKEQN